MTALLESMDNAFVWYERQLKAEIQELKQKLFLRDAELIRREADRESLLLALKGNRHTSYRLPAPHEIAGEHVCLPLVVGTLPGLKDLQHPFDTPWSRQQVYTLTFTKEYAHNGTYWRLQPFCTEPR